MTLNRCGVNFILSETMKSEDMSVNKDKDVYVCLRYMYNVYYNTYIL